MRTDKGWEFSLDQDGVDLCSEYDSCLKYMQPQIPSIKGRATVPTIVDVKEKKVVNNDYHRLSNYWETVWKPSGRGRTQSLSFGTPDRNRCT